MNSDTIRFTRSARATHFCLASFMFPQAHYHTFDVPKGARLLASSADYPNQAFQWRDHVFAFQFHPEATPKHMQEHWLNQPWGEESSWKAKRSVPRGNRAPRQIA